jgi:hypothetical protein
VVSVVFELSEGREGRERERETPEQFNFLRRLGLSLFFAWAGWKAGRGSSPITVGPTNDPSFFLKIAHAILPGKTELANF